MRVFQLNDCDAYCGKTLLQAVRAARKDSGLSFYEIVDRAIFREVPESEWPTKMLRDLDDYAVNKQISLAEVMANMDGPGMAYSSEY